MYHEKYLELIDKIKETGDVDELKKTEGFVQYFKEYVNLVYKISLKIPVLETQFDPDLAEHGITTLKDLEKNNLQSVIDACHYLNLTCRVYGLKPFCPRLSADKKEFADFASDFVSEMFQAGLQNKPVLE